MEPRLEETSAATRVCVSSRLGVSTEGLADPPGIESNNIVAVEISLGSCKEPWLVVRGCTTGEAVACSRTVVSSNENCDEALAATDETSTEEVTTSIIVFAPEDCGSRIDSAGSEGVTI